MTINQSERPVEPTEINHETTIYRSGSLIPNISTDSDDYFEMYRFFDELKPDNRQGRQGALYASPDEESLALWETKDSKNYKLTVDADTTLVYPVSVYEEAGYAWDNYEQTGSEDDYEDLLAVIAQYWDSAMTLTSFYEWSETHEVVPGDWEILLSPNEVLSSRPI